MKRRLFAAGLVAAPFAKPAFAQTGAPPAWTPSSPIRMIVAYPAGGPVDVIARIVAADMGAPLGQQIVTENQSGGAGSIGTRFVAKSKPDGLTITFGTNQTHGNNMFMLKDPGYDAVKDFAPLAGAGAFEHVFVVRKDLPVKNIQDLIKLAKDKPGTINFGSTGIGSGAHLTLELFMVRTGTKMTHVPYRGAPPLVQDLIGGRIDVAASTLPSVLAQITSGQIRAIAIASPKRNPHLPDVPTLEEQGVTGANASSWAAFFAPAATPQPILDRLSGVILASLKKPDVVDRIDKLGFTVEPQAPASFRPYQVKELETWMKIAKDAGIKPEE
jgi:tripartite-type tricarboxylate transporter receptor subunit TctC